MGGVFFLALGADQSARRIPRCLKLFQSSTVETKLVIAVVRRAFRSCLCPLAALGAALFTERVKSSPCLPAPETCTAEPLPTLLCEAYCVRFVLRATMSRVIWPAKTYFCKHEQSKPLPFPC